jgi:hypothetical protein
MLHSHIADKSSLKQASLKQASSKSFAENATLSP